MALGQEAERVVVHRPLLLHQFGKQRQTPRALHLIGVNERRLIGTALALQFEVIGDRVVPVEVDHQRRHPVALPKLMDGRGNHILLSVPVQQDLLAETHVPEPGDHGPQEAREDLFRNHHRARHAEMVIRVRPPPQWFGDGAPGTFRHRLGHPRHQEDVLADRRVGPVRLRGPQGHDQDVIRLQTFLDIAHRHRLQIDAGALVHVPAFRRQVPLRHE